MANYQAPDTEFQAVANAIRTKGGTSGQLTWPTGFVSAINAIPSGGIPIPTGSQLLKYIEVNGTQYINTGHVLTANGRMVIDTYVTDSGYLFQAGAEESNKYLSMNSWISAYSAQWNYALAAYVASTRYNNGLVHIDYDLLNHKFIWNYKEEYSLATVIDSQLPSLPAHLFQYNTGSVRPVSKGILFGAKIYESNVLVHDYYPAIDPNNVVCLWDNVDQVFVYNAGTGDFIAGV